MLRVRLSLSSSIHFLLNSFLGPDEPRMHSADQRGKLSIHCLRSMDLCFIRCKIAKGRTWSRYLPCVVYSNVAGLMLIIGICKTRSKSLWYLLLLTLKRGYAHSFWSGRLSLMRHQEFYDAVEALSQQRFGNLLEMHGGVHSAAVSYFFPVVVVLHELTPYRSNQTSSACLLVCASSRCIQDWFLRIILSFFAMPMSMMMLRHLPFS